ncbi:MAG TPA: NTP transferase domain-containing protein [Nocardioidaceae bacterium]|nr:NTP transferase domain-containing protein [Nocardioidaceae bacterium]
MTTPHPSLAAVILAGGGGVRLGGVEKASIEIHGQTLLEHALAGTAAADEVVVVGPELPTSRPVTWTRESPPGGGPAAGMLAGLGALAVRPELVCVLAVDMPRFSAATLDRLVDVLMSAGDEADGACLVDRAHHKQWLAAVYRYDALTRARPADRATEHGLSIRRLMMPLRILGVPATAHEARDVDTWADLRDLRELDD